ncbi:MAG: hypothetical protein V4850_37050 [Myxococcota bacterium]
MNPRAGHLLNTLRERVATWAHRTHPAELRANVRRSLGRAPATEGEARGALAFALITAPVGGASLIDRFVAQAGRSPRAERLCFEEWARTRFCLLCVTDVAPGEWIEAHDVLADRLLVIPERSGSESIDIGMWLAAFVYEADGREVFEGALSLVPLPARVYAVQAALQTFAALRAVPTDAPPATTRQVANATLDAIHRAIRPPRFVNVDGDPVEVIVSTLAEPWDAVRRVLSSWPDITEDPNVVDVYGLQPATHGGGEVVRATFLAANGAVTLQTNSRARHDEILARWTAATGTALVVRSESVKAAGSNPDGPELIVEQTILSGNAGATPESLTDAMFEQMDAAWPDDPIPALDGLTPRQAVAAGRRAEVWALAAAPDGGLWASAEVLLRR